MARDYKYRTQAKSKKKPVNCWVAFVAGLLLGVLGVGLSWLKFGGGAESGPQWISAKPTQAEPDSRRPAAPPPHFDFYERLPEMEVVVPEEALPAPVSTAPNAPTPPAAAATPLLVQVGSFKKSSDADRLKAQLVLLGMEVRVSRVKIDDGDTWHRVRVGPFTTRKTLEDARKRLAENGLKGIVIRAAGG